jgi:hypothetical protein
VLVSVGVGLAVSVGESVGPPVSVGVGEPDQPGHVLESTPDGPVAGWVGVPEGVGEGQAAAVVGGSADETAAAMLEVGVAVAVAAAVEDCWHCAVADADAVPLAFGPALAVPWAPLVADPPPAPDGEPLPSVPPPPDDWPPVSTLLVTCPMAARSGGTATATIAMKATAASAPSGRIQLTPVVQLPLRRAGRCRWRAWARDSGEGEDGAGAACQAQCPLHTQYLARLTAPLTTLSSHG